MWVYQQTESSQSLSEHPYTEKAVSVPLSAEPTLEPLPDAQKKRQPVSPILPPMQGTVPRRVSAQKRCWALVCTFLLGSAAAGVLQAICEQQPPDWMPYYIQRWENLFASASAQTAASLFGVQYLTLAAAATIMLLLGFSALGPVLILLFMMFYGLGNGTLTVQLFSAVGPQRGAGILLIAALPAAVAAAGLCLLGADALQVSGQIRACSFFSPGVSSGPVHETVRPNTLMRAYLLTIVLFLPLCGISTAFANISSSL